MSTAGYLQRSLFKWKYAILIILIISAMIAVFSFLINRRLPDLALSFSDLIGQEFHSQISYGKVHYRFPNHIIFKNVKVLTLESKSPMLQASRVTMDFYFPSFSSTIPLKGIIINDLAVNFPVLKHYWTLHNKKIHAWTKTFPKGNIRLLVPNGQFYPTGYFKGGPIAFNINIKLDQRHLSAHGSWGNKDKFIYKCNGNIRDPGFDLDNLTLEDSHSSVNLWGRWHDKDIFWKGFILYEKLYILDIDGHMQIQPQDIALKQLSFSVNGDEITASGHCLKQNIYQCDADIASKKIDLHLHSRNTAHGISFTGAVGLPSVQVNFENLKAWIINGNSLKLNLTDITLVFKNMAMFHIFHGHEHKFSARDLLASIHFAKPYQKTITFSANMYAGHVQSRIFLDTSSSPWQIRGQGKIDGIDINRFNNDLSYFKRCHGLVSANFNIQRSKTIEFTGSFVLQHGDFYGSSFQAWIARILQMPSLEHVSDAQMSSHFTINGDVDQLLTGRRDLLLLDDLKLNTDDLNLNGFFHLDEDDLVSSQVSVRFSKELLDESSMGRDIIHLVHGAWTLPVEFSLAGNVHRMNFQWDKSPLKDNVHRHLFSFIERMIDRRMNARPAYKVTIPSESVSPG